MPEPPVLPTCEPLTVAGDERGALVLHGFTSCPQSVKPLADAFAGAGFSVELPLLPGHGTTVDDMIATGWRDWSAAAEDAYRALAARCRVVVVAGLSMGGALTAWLASRHPEVAGIVCVNPVVRVTEDITGFARQMLDDGQDRMPAIAGDIADPDATEAGYQEMPLGPLLSLAEGTDELRRELGKVTSPVLIMTSSQDHVVPPANSDELAGAVGGPVERIALERSYHVATLDHDRDLVAREALSFAQRVVALTPG